MGGENWGKRRKRIKGRTFGRRTRLFTPSFLSRGLFPGLSAREKISLRITASPAKKEGKVLLREI